MRHLRSDYDDLFELDNRIGENEPVFLLRGQDPSAAVAVRAWADDVEKRGGDEDLVATVRRWADDMAEWAEVFGKKVADVPDGALRKTDE